MKDTGASVPPSDSADVRSARSISLTLRVLLLSIGFTVLGAWWVQRNELIAFTVQISESVPPIPALAAVLVVLMLGAAVRWLTRSQIFGRRDLLFIYAFLTVSIPMASVGVVRAWFPFLTVPRYFATSENQWANLAERLPGWLVPKDEEVIRAAYEGTQQGTVPWRAWAVPLVVWSLVFLLFFMTSLCMLILLRKQWEEKERLTFPLLEIPRRMTNQTGGGAGLAQVSSTQRAPPFFRDPVTWAGIGLAVFFNALNVAGAFDPSIPAPGRMASLNPFLTSRPLNALYPFDLHYRPELTGLGFLMPLEVSFTTWVCFLLEKAAALIGALAGHQTPGFPLEQEQATGAYVLLGLLLLWTARSHLRQVVRKAWRGDPTVDDSQEPLSYRTALVGAAGGFGLLWAFGVAAGLSWWVAPLYFGLLLGFAAVYARIRAECGVPNIWLFPYWQHKKFLLYIFGSGALAPGGDVTSLTVLSALAFFSRGYFPQLSGYQVDNLRLAEPTRAARRGMVGIMLVALVVGLVCAYYIHFSAYYRYGNNILEAGTTSGGYRTQLAVEEYQTLGALQRRPVPPDWQRLEAAAVGGLITAGMWITRRLYLRFPFHPAGFAMATAFGNVIWFPFFVAWGCKWLALRVGGMRLYQRLVPGFVGLAVGQFAAGGVWALVGAFYPDAARQYMVWFG